MVEEPAEVREVVKGLPDVHFLEDRPCLAPLVQLGDPMESPEAAVPQGAHQVQPQALVWTLPEALEQAMVM